MLSPDTCLQRLVSDLLPLGSSLTEPDDRILPSLALGEAASFLPSPFGVGDAQASSFYDLTFQNETDESILGPQPYQTHYV